MSVPSLWARAAVLLALVLLAGGGVLLKRRQSRGGIGGAISAPKAFWLSFTVFFWFFLCPVLALDGALSRPIRLAFGAFAISMWARGVAELVMLYGTKNWRPPYGIAHDIFCIVLVAAVLLHDPARIAALTRPLDLFALGLLVVVAASLLVEIQHAHSFHAVVGEDTKGDRAIWFADDADRRFARINRRTRIWNAILGGAVSVFLAVWLGLVPV